MEELKVAIPDFSLGRKKVKKFKPLNGFTNSFEIIFDLGKIH